MQWRFFIIFLVWFLCAESVLARKSRTPNEILQKILFYENRRISKLDYLLKSLNHPSMKVKKAAVLALGRIGDPSRLDEMARLLSHRNHELRKYGIFSLSLIGGTIPLQIVTQNLPMHKNIKTRTYLLTAIGRMGNARSVQKLANTLQPDSPTLIAGAICESLGLLWSQDSHDWALPPKLLSKLARIARGNSENALLAAFAISRFKGEAPFLPEEEFILTANQAQNSFSRAFMHRALRNVSHPKATALLAKSLTSSPHQAVRIESAKSLIQHPTTPRAVQALIAALGDRSRMVVYEALQTLSQLIIFDESALNAIQKTFKSSPSTWIQGTALTTLASLNPDIARNEAIAILKKHSSPLLPYAIHALGIIGTPKDIQSITPYLEHSSSLVKQAVVQAFLLVAENSIPPGAKTLLIKQLDQGDAALTPLIAQLIRQNLWKEFSQSLNILYPFLKKPEHLEARIAVLKTLSYIGNTSHLPIIKKALKDPQPLVIEAALQAHKSITGNTLSLKIPLNSRLESPTPKISSLLSSLNKRIILKTTRGVIHLLTLSDTPLTSYNFVQLVKNGFYNGTVFHRVVPNFVVQGGDPRGDGYGGPGYFIRDEISLLRHTRGTVALAHAGKDTGGSQFFINLAPNHHLNGKYTIFARVVTGLSVVDKLEIGDRILSATVQN